MYSKMTTKKITSVRNENRGENQKIIKSGWVGFFFLIVHTAKDANIQSIKPTFHAYRLGPIY